LSGVEDRKTKEVVLAQYAYRHEAEFAAGFLDDAGIPYRLQIDDPAMGLTIATPATLWVRAFDLAGARELLDTEDQALGDATPSKPTEPSVRTRAVTPARPRGALSSGGSRPVGRTEATPTPLPSGSGLMPGPQLGVRERGLALVAAIGFAASAPVARDGGPEGLVVALVVMAAGLFVVAAFGRAPGFLRRLLRTLSGSAP